MSPAGPERQYLCGNRITIADYFVPFIAI